MLTAKKALQELNTGIRMAGDLSLDTEFSSASNASASVLPATGRNRDGIDKKEEFLDFIMELPEVQRIIQDNTREQVEQSFNIKYRNLVNRYRTAIQEAVVREGTSR